MSKTSMTRAEVRAFDEAAIQAGIPGMILMENAARGAAELLTTLGIAGPVLILVGKGNNGGDGLVMARHLAYFGKEVAVELFAAPDQLTGDARTAYESLLATDVPIHPQHPFDRPGLTDRVRTSEWLVDGLLGTGTQGAARAPIDEVIRIVNGSRRRVFAIDLPSGLDADTGLPTDPTIRADVTATFVARKVGFDHPESRPFTGPVHVLPIGTAKG